MTSRVAIVVVVFLIFSACSRKSVRQLEKSKIALVKTQTPISVNATDNSLQIQYLGSGGMLIAEPGRNVMIDPFFSHQNLTMLGLATVFGCKIKSKKSMIAFGGKRILNSNIVTKEQL